jgi:hypothetical protein
MSAISRRLRPTLLLTLTAAALTAALLLAVPGAQADPIKNLSMDPYRAGWYSNASRGGPLTCAETCKQKASALPEHEPSAEPVPKRAFLCKVQGKPKGDLRTWLYGNQFDDRAACYTVGLDLKGSYSDKYFCLCVDPIPRRVR